MTALVNMPIPMSDEAILAGVARLARQRRVWLRVGLIVDGISNQPLRDASVVFDARQIYEVCKGGALPARESLAPGRYEPDAILPNATLLPCLIEAHAHLFLQGGNIDLAERKAYLKLPPDELLARARARWPAILQSGIGAVRDAGDKDGVGLALATEARARCGQVTSTPWIDSPGAALYHRGRYGSFMGRPLEENATGAECVADRVRDGADRIKLLVSGIIDFAAGAVTAPPQMETVEVAEIVRAAREHGRQTFAHASGTDGIENAVRGGVTTVEHGYFITAEQLLRMRDSSIAWVPTMAPVAAQYERADQLGWQPAVVDQLSRILDGHRQMLCQAHAIGVTILAGSDAGSCGVPHGVGLLRELAYLEQAGLPTMSVLQSATGASAATLQFAEPVGRIAAGCRSRFIITRHDLLTTIANLQREKVILFDGELISGKPDVDVACL